METHSNMDYPKNMGEGYTPAQTEELDLVRKVAKIQTMRASLLDLNNMDKAEKANDAIAEWGGNIRKKYGNDASNYMFFHLVSGSTPIGTPPSVDFPGEDSALAFIEKLYADLEGK